MIHPSDGDDLQVPAEAVPTLRSIGSYLQCWGDDETVEYDMYLSVACVLSYNMIRHHPSSHYEQPVSNKHSYLRLELRAGTGYTCLGCDREDS